MKSLLLTSIVWFTLVVPAVLARDRSAVRAAKWLLASFAVFTTLYVLYVAYFHTRYFVPYR